MTEYVSFFLTARAAGVIEDAVPISKVLLTVLNFLLSVAGIVGIIGLVVAGFWYLTAAGDEGRVRVAKKAMLASVIGLVVVLSALLIVTQLGKFFS